MVSFLLPSGPVVLVPQPASNPAATTAAKAIIFENIFTIITGHHASDCDDRLNQGGRFDESTASLQSRLETVSRGAERVRSRPAVTGMQYSREMASRNSNNKIANSLVAMSSAAVLAVYAAGYVRTQTAADLLQGQSAERRRPAVRPSVVEQPAAPVAAAEVEAPAPAEVARVEVAKPKPAQIAPLAESSPAPVETAPAPPPVEAPPPVVPPPVAEPVPAPPPPAAPPKPVWKDGTYTGWGTSRHGDIQAAVVIQSGRIASATIAQCLTRYSCDVIDKLIPQVAARQSPDIDYVSGATQSSDAFYYAVVGALNKAK
jgi:uncharacterized protein with FMN-binding domain